MRGILGVIFVACLICHLCSSKKRSDRRKLNNYLSGHGRREMSLQGGFREKIFRNKSADADAGVPGNKSVAIIHGTEPYKGLPSLTSIVNVERFANWTNWTKCDPYDCIQFRHRQCLDDTWTEAQMVPFGNADCMSKYYVETRSCKNKATCLPANKMRNCGARPTSAGIMNKIVGGEASKPNSWPWAVRLTEGFDPLNATLLCGGTLIAPQWIVTAAHCITNYKKLTSFDETEEVENVYAHLGDHLANETEKTQRDYLVKIAIIHPSYTPGFAVEGYDIALLYLSEPVEMEPEVNFACLPNRAIDWASDGKCYAVGWGKTQDPSDVGIFDYIWELFSSWREPDTDHNVRQSSRSGGMSNVLQEVRLPILSYDECTVHFPPMDEKLHICAGTTGKDTCNGDSGGGLYCQLPNSNRWVITGVTSFGSNDGCGRRPGIYTSVLGNHYWIRRSISEFQIPLNMKYRPSIMSPA